MALSTIVDLSAPYKINRNLTMIKYFFFKETTTYVNIPNKSFYSFIDEYIQDSYILISLDVQMSINQFKYNRESKGAERYSFVYHEEIQRNGINKTAEFIGEDAYLYYGNFGIFLNRYLSNKFIAHAEAYQFVKRADKHITPMLLYLNQQVLFNQSTQPLN